MVASRHRAIVVVHLLVSHRGAQGDELLLLRRPAVGVAGGLWAPPGGHLEGGETPMRAALRECREELGVVLSGPLEPRALLVYDDDGDAGFNLVFHGRLERRATLVPDPAAASDARYWPRTALPEDRVPWLDAALAAGASPKAPWYAEP